MPKLRYSLPFVLLLLSSLQMIAASSNPFKPFFGAKWVIQSAFVTACSSNCPSVCVTNVSIDDGGPDKANMMIQLLASSASRSGRTADPGPYLVVLSVTSSSGPNLSAQGTFPGVLGGPDENVTLSMDSVNYGFNLNLGILAITSAPSASVVVSPAVSLIVVIIFLLFIVAL